MRRWWLYLAPAAALGLALGAVAVWSVWVRPARGVHAEPVPDGDVEAAFIHTTSGGESWDTFVIAAKRAEMNGEGCVPGLRVDVGRAFPQRATAVPEVVISRDGYPGNIRVRWYKVTDEVSADDWVKALARRDIPPAALIGGWTSEAAKKLAEALNGQTDWAGDRPLLLLTEATADEVHAPPGDADDFPASGTLPELIRLYPGRTFRFCFTNRQMAEAVTDYLLSDPTLRPGPAVWPGFRAAGVGAAGPWAAAAGVADILAPGPSIFSLEWKDDPYSQDLADKFKGVLYARLAPPPFPHSAGRPPNAPRVDPHPIPFSVGGFARPNPGEAAAVRDILDRLPPPAERSVLVLPTSSTQARRVLLALSERVPQVGRRLVAVTGDAVSVNTLYRDAEFTWPARSIPIPVVLFSHANPFGWDTDADQPPPGYRLRPKNTTQIILLLTDLTRTLASGVFPDPQRGAGRRTLTRADEVANEFRCLNPPVFDDVGNRLGGRGEHVVVLRPTLRYGVTMPGQPRPDATIEAYRRRSSGAGWDLVRAEPVLPEKPRREGPPE